VTRPQFINLLKSILQNIGVVAVGFGVASVGKRIDALLGLHDFASLRDGRRHPITRNGICATRLGGVLLSSRVAHYELFSMIMRR
jgi:hypothetical protein